MDKATKKIMELTADLNFFQIWVFWRTVYFTGLKKLDKETAGNYLYTKK